MTRMEAYLFSVCITLAVVVTGLLLTR